MAKNTTKPAPQSGYELPIYGLQNGTFYYIHIPAIICIVSSFICALTSIILSFRRRRWRNFFKSWSKTDRFVVYLAICDGLFNVSHSMDHIHITIARDMVYPKELCELYGFNITVFVTAQNLMVNVVAINAFCLLYFNKNLNFGRNDWKLLLWTFGVPALGAAIAGITGQLGPTGAFCYFDAIKGKYTHIFFTTIPLLGVLIVNTVLYILTWTKIYRQIRAVKETLGSMSANMHASHRAARAMSLFVAAFFIQWGALALYGAWSLVTENVPQPLFNVMTILSNIGGDLNLGVYLLIRKQQPSRGNNISTVDNKSLSGEMQMSKRTPNTTSHLSTSDMTHEQSATIEENATCL